jgi:hypothetical protein
VYLHTRILYAGWNLKTQKNKTDRNAVYNTSKSYGLSLLATFFFGTIRDKVAISKIHMSIGPFSLFVIHKEGLCPSSGDINKLMM